MSQALKKKDKKNLKNLKKRKKREDMLKSKNREKHTLNTGVETRSSSARLEITTLYARYSCGRSTEASPEP